MEGKQPAGFWVRLFAGIVDGIAVSIVILPLTYLIYGDMRTGVDNPVNLLRIIYAILLPAFWFGYTLGKRAAGVRIVQKDGSDVGFGRMAAREVGAAVVYGLTFGIGLIVSAFMVGMRKDKRSIHDLIAGTYVTHLEPPQYS
ncbi:RDD family protein [Halobacillus litoralis]|uniref:RDD family protein n=1 Tax=Halobacillus litoralis TaxID=45668 RepID=UPI001CFDFE02|nr:RDD family protein [Halobacillus litoralis]